MGFVPGAMDSLCKLETTERQMNALLVLDFSLEL